MNSACETVSLADIPGLSLWELDHPVLYDIEAVLSTAAGTDTLSSTFGFRTAQFTTAGFFLNDRVVKIRGLNRHQSWPYTGYAMGRRAQERDAEILKYELKCNLVRTSHYPQSPWFLDHCDRIGLLVFEEIPGWQHIGGEEWQAESVCNVERMIRRDWNRPSIVIWGVRINESPDADDFYARTNEVARALDPTRQTGGVRCITDSEMLEDVYTMSDFVLGLETLPGANRARTPLRVIVRALDQIGNILPYLDGPVQVRVSGAARLLGPETIVLNGGTIGFWIETTGQPGRFWFAYRRRVSRHRTFRFQPSEASWQKRGRPAPKIITVRE